MEKKFIKDFIEEQKHKEFIKGEKFGEELFDKKESLLKIYIVPLSISREKIDFLSEEIKGWLVGNHYLDNPWHFFINGVRTMNFTKEKESLSYVLSIFKNATVSYCRKLPYSNPEGKLISPKEIKSLIEGFMAIGGRFYGRAKLDVPVKIYLELKRIKGSVLNSSEITTPKKYSLELEGKWYKENLILNEESSIKKISTDYPRVARKISNRLAQAFGLWEL